MEMVEQAGETRIGSPEAASRAVAAGALTCRSARTSISRAWFASLDAYLHLELCREA